MKRIKVERPDLIEAFESNNPGLNYFLNKESGEVVKVAEDFCPDETISGVTPFAIAQDVTLDLLRYVIMAVPGVKTISFTSPATDIQVGEDELAVLSGIDLTYVWATEE